MSYESRCKKKSAASERIWPHRIGRFEDDSSYSAQLAPAQWHVLTKFSAMEITTTKSDLIPLGAFYKKRRRKFGGRRYQNFVKFANG